MARPLRALLIDDSPEDADLLVAHLRRKGFDVAWERVDTAKALTEALERHEWDLIAYDWVMPQFSGPTALEILQQRRVDVPIIVVSGQVGEEYAVTAMRAGAQDFVSKHNLARLCPAIHRELEQVEVRRARRRAEEAAFRLARIVECSNDAIIGKNLDGIITSWNPAAERLYGYSAEEVVGRSISIITPRGHEGEVPAILERLRIGESIEHYETVRRRKDGREIDVSLSISPIRDTGGQVVAVSTIARDITDRKRAEVEYKTVLETARDGFWLVDLQGNILDVNQAYCSLSGYGRAELLTMNVRDVEAQESPAEIARRIQQVIDVGHDSFESRHRCKDGRILDVEVRINFQDVAGARFFAFIHDITERKQAEEVLRAIEERMGLIAETIHEAFWITGADTEQVLYISPGYEQIWGRSCASLYDNPRSWFDAAHPEDRGRVLASLARLAGMHPFEEEYRIVRPDGTIRWIWDRGRSVTDNTGTVTSYVGVALDITERKRAEEALERVNTFLAEGQELAHVGSWEYLADSRETYWSAEEFRIFGLTPAGKSPTYDEMLEHHVHPDDIAFLDEGFGDAVRNRAIFDFEHRIVRPDGSVRVIYDRAVPHFDEQGKLLKYTGATLDITERKQAEEALRESEARYRSVITALGDGIVLQNAAGEIVACNPSAERILGMTADQMQGRTSVDPRWRSVHEDGSPFPGADHPAMVALRTGSPQHGVVMGVHKPSGELTWVSINAEPIPGPKGSATSAVVSSFADITERKRAEDELRRYRDHLEELVAERTATLAQANAELADALAINLQNQKQLRARAAEVEALMEAMPALTFVAHDPECRRMTSSRRAEELLRVPPGGNTSKSAHPEERPTAFRTLRDGKELQPEELPVQLAAATGQPQRNARVTLDFGEGGQRHLFGDAVPLFDDNGAVRGAVGAFLDITTEVTLHASNKDLEQFAYVASHDLRAPLRHIEGFTSILEEDLGPQLSEEHRQNLAQVSKAAARMNKMITALLGLSRVGRANLEMQKVGLGEIVAAAFADLQAATPGRKVEFVAQPLPAVLADRTLLRQLFDNLLGNALKFTRPVAAPRIEVGVERGDGKEVIFVRDNGVGFDAAKAEELFGPFQRYHSESEFEGTGIGLSIVKRIVERHGGRVWAESAPGAGATFRFTLG